MVIIPVLNYQKKIGRKEQNEEGGFAKGGDAKTIQGQAMQWELGFLRIFVSYHILAISYIPSTHLFRFSLSPLM